MLESFDPRGELTHTLPTYTVARHSYGPDALNFADLYLPATPGLHAVVPLIHGGFWRAAYDLTLMNGLAAYLAQHGIAAWNIEYRRVGDAGGGWPGTLQDAAQSLDYLRTLATSYDLDLLRILPVGHSAGGHLALWLAARSRLPRHSPLSITETPLALAGAISLAGALDLEQVWRLHLGKDAAAELLGGSPDEVPERYATASPAALLPLGIPQVLLHGTNDDRVPLIVSQDYTRKAKSAGDQVELIELPGANHFVVIDPSSQAWSTTMRAIRMLIAQS